MQSDHEIWEKLSSLSQFQALVRILRSDNPLIALGVETREECWTRFQEWLLDPHYHSDPVPFLFATALVHLAADSASCSQPDSPALETRQPGGHHLQRLSELGTPEVNSIEEVRAEQRIRGGRIDLLLKCEAGNAPVVVVIENKIESSEREGQLQDYVREVEKDLNDDDILVPILLELGDKQSNKCCCEWAICWGRQDAAKWLKSGMDLCEARGLKAPALVQSYLDLFAAFDAKKTLIDKHRDLIEAAAQSAEEYGAHLDWTLLQEWLTIGDFPFFKDVCESLKAKLQGYKVEPYGTILGRNAGLTVTKEGWYLPKRDDDEKAVNIYFESRWRGDFRLNVCLYPYEGGLSEKKARRMNVEGLLKTKMKLMRDLREKLESRRGQLPQFELDFSYTLGPDRPNALTIVKFKPHKPTDGWQPEDLANLIQDVINTLAGIVDEVADPYRVPTEGPS